MSRTTGRAVPLSLPLDSQNLRVLRSLRQSAAELDRRLGVLAQLRLQLRQLASKQSWDAFVPVQGTTSLAYGSSSSGSKIVQTDRITVELGGEEDGQSDSDETSSYFVEYSASQAAGVAERKAERALHRRNRETRRRR